MQETGPTVYSPYLRSLINRIYNKFGNFWKFYSERKMLKTVRNIAKKAIKGWVSNYKKFKSDNSNLDTHVIARRLRDK